MQWFQPLVSTIVSDKLPSIPSHEREDVSQEIFQRVFAKLQTWNRSGWFCSWVSAVAANFCVDVARALGREGSTVVSPAALNNAHAPANPVDPAVIEALEAAAARLPDRLGELYELEKQRSVYGEPLTNKDIADTLRVSERMYYVLKREMVRLLKDCIGPK